MSVTNIPMMNADIVTGISLMLLFVFIGRLIGINESLGFLTVLIAHVTFNLPYVILSVLPKLVLNLVQSFFFTYMCFAIEFIGITYYLFLQTDGAVVL